MKRPFLVVLLTASLLVAHRAVATAAGCQPTDTKKTTICHVPPGDPTAKQTVCIGNSAVRAHLSNHPGDNVGVCGSANCGNGICDANLGETAASCAADCGCACQAAVNATGLAVDLGTALGVGTANLAANVCSACGNASSTSATFTFTPSVSAGSTAFTFTARMVGAPTCTVNADASGTVATTGTGTIAAGAQQQSANFTLTLVNVAGSVCTAILNLDPATVLGISGSLTIPLSVPCGDSTLETCPAP